MGRGKPNMELIPSEKTRTLTFKKRKEGLFKKMHELTTLCDVKACAFVIYGASSKPEIWPPQDLESVARLIDAYKVRKKDLGQVRSCGVSDFFEERKRKPEEELQRLRKKNRECTYPSWFESLNSKSEDELRQFSAVLKNKIDLAQSRIEQIKRTEKELADLISHSNHLQQQQQDPMSMDMMMMAMKNNSYNDNPLPSYMNYGQLRRHNNNDPPQCYMNYYGQQGGVLVNGITQQSFDPIRQNQGDITLSQFMPQISYTPTNVSFSPVLPPQAPYLQNHMTFSNMELAGFVGDNGGLEDILAYMRRRR